MIYDPEITGISPRAAVGSAEAGKGKKRSTGKGAVAGRTARPAFAGLLCGLLAALPVSAADTISIAQMNAMMADYCSICHLDAAMNGGLSLEHFDAATISPSLAAVLVSKFTTGVPLDTVRAAPTDPAAAAEVEEGKKFGAVSVMGIAGIPLPEKAVIDGFIQAMASRADGASAWHVVHKGNVITADVSRGTAAHRFENRESIFRLVLTCNADTREGEMVLAWSPSPVNGELQAVVDGGAPLRYVLDQQEAMANGGPGRSSPSSVVLNSTVTGSKHPQMPLPSASLNIDGPFPTEHVAFSFTDLGQSDLESLSICFGQRR